MKIKNSTLFFYNNELDLFYYFVDIYERYHGIFFCQDKLEYLGYCITTNHIQPLLQKVQAILDIDTLKTKKELRSFIGIVNYYQDSWIRGSDLLAPK